VSLRILVERRKHDWQNDFHVIADEIAEIFIVPKVKRTLCDLEVRASDGLGELMEKRFLDLCEFSRVHDFENVLNLVQEHDFLGAVDLGPVPEKAKDDLGKWQHCISLPCH
jgi:hypothetical protein